MGRGLFFVAAATAISLCAVASSGAASKSLLCGPEDGTTVAEGSKARVYTVEVSGESSTFGCSPSGPHPWKLGPFGRGEARAQFWETPLLAGLWAGGLFRSHGRDTYRYTVRSRNLRTGEEIRCEAGGGVAPRRGENVYKVVLSRHGSLAWSGEYWIPVYETPVGPGPGATAPMPLPKKHIYECSGTEREVIERGEEIALGSLALTGQNLSWINGGEEKTARLP